MQFFTKILIFLNLSFQHLCALYHYIYFIVILNFIVLLLKSFSLLHGCVSFLVFGIVLLCIRFLKLFFFLFYQFFFFTVKGFSDVNEFFGEELNNFYSFFFPILDGEDNGALKKKYRMRYAGRKRLYPLDSSAKIVFKNALQSSSFAYVVRERFTDFLMYTIPFSWLFLTYNSSLWLFLYGRRAGSFRLFSPKFFLNLLFKNESVSFFLSAPIPVFKVQNNSRNLSYANQIHFIFYFFFLRILYFFLIFVLGFITVALLILSKFIFLMINLVFVAFFFLFLLFLYRYQFFLLSYFLRLFRISLVYAENHKQNKNSFLNIYFIGNISNRILNLKQEFYNFAFLQKLYNGHQFLVNLYKNNFGLFFVNFKRNQKLGLYNWFFDRFFGKFTWHIFMTLSQMRFSFYSNYLFYFGFFLLSKREFLFFFSKFMLTIMLFFLTTLRKCKDEPPTFLALCKSLCYLSMSVLFYFILFYFSISNIYNPIFYFFIILSLIFFFVYLFLFSEIFSIFNSTIIIWLLIKLLPNQIAPFNDFIYFFNLYKLIQNFLFFCDKKALFFLFQGSLLVATQTCTNSPLNFYLKFYNLEKKIFDAESIFFRLIGVYRIFAVSKFSIMDSSILKHFLGLIPWKRMHYLFIKYTGSRLYKVELDYNLLIKFLKISPRLVLRRYLNLILRLMHNQTIVLLHSQFLLHRGIVLNWVQFFFFKQCFCTDCLLTHKEVSSSDFELYDNNSNALVACVDGSRFCSNNLSNFGKFLSKKESKFICKFCGVWRVCTQVPEFHFVPLQHNLTTIFVENFILQLHFFENMIVSVYGKQRFHFFQKALLISFISLQMRKHYFFFKLERRELCLLSATYHFFEEKSKVTEFFIVDTLLRYNLIFFK